MNDKKQVEEMAKVIDKSHWRIVQGWKGCRLNSEEIAENIYAAGYRKSSEVAREIFEEIENSISPMLGLEDDKESVAILATTFAELKKKYTE